MCMLIPSVLLLISFVKRERVINQIWNEILELKPGSERCSVCVCVCYCVTSVVLMNSDSQIIAASSSSSSSSSLSSPCSWSEPFFFSGMRWSPASLKITIFSLVYFDMSLNISEGVRNVLIRGTVRRSDAMLLGFVFFLLILQKLQHTWSI